MLMITCKIKKRTQNLYHVLCFLSSFFFCFVLCQYFSCVILCVPVFWGQIHNASLLKYMCKTGFVYRIRLFMKIFIFFNTKIYLTRCSNKCNILRKPDTSFYLLARIFFVFHKRVILHFLVFGSFFCFRLVYLYKL